MSARVPPQGWKRGRVARERDREKAVRKFRQRAHAWLCGIDHHAHRNLHSVHVRGVSAEVLYIPWRRPES